MLIRVRINECIKNANFTLANRDLAYEVGEPLLP